MKLHAVNILALWFWLLSLLPWLERLSLFLLAALLFCMALFFAGTRLSKSLPRMRWLLLAVFMIYAWSTPGVYLWPHALSPTVNGISLAIEQLARLVCVVASLQIMLTFLSKSAIVAGLYYLLLPLDWIGFRPERMAVRLSLTLDYAEQLLEQKNRFADVLGDLMRAPEPSGEQLAIEFNGLSLTQAVFLVVQLGAIALTILIGNAALWN
ncbi:hypothetical protein ABHF33_16380 [Chitinibacter sp. FCG-7]|uniref:Energy-coupling factor transporter transmembrane protein EcfT n=1 Tax=Chitinibacter mangrovi TaxID=3153927 RepID=A0AAU7FA79_9NEIS